MSSTFAGFNFNLYGTRPTVSFQGISPQQTINSFKTSEETAMRKVLVKSWNNPYATGTVNGKKRIITPFRAVNNSGDFLARPYYSCGGPNPTNKTRSFYQHRIGAITNMCDGTNIPASSCNTKFVSDSSDYTKFKKQMAYVKNYNDLKFGGDQSHASYDARIRIHRR
jgi:hypothetical protein